MSVKKLKKLSVRLYGKEVGILEERAGKMRFRYNTGVTTAISLSLPIIEEVYPERACKAYFGGLLPENHQIRKALGIRYKINPNNDFALLAAIGNDCAGAVSFYPVETPETSYSYLPLKGDLISEEELEEHLKNLPTKPYMGRRLSLAGVQEKTPISMIDGKFVLPSDESPTTHIIKPPLERFPETVINEYICLKTGAELGFSAPRVEIKQAGKTFFFLIERFDRIVKDNKIKRLHHEDFTQALGIKAEDKYNVTFRDCASLLRHTTQPAKEKLTFLSYVIYNYLIGNCDAHGKNFSLLYLENGTFLAPLYDVLCTMVYDLEHEMSMKIGKAKYIEDVTRKDWALFAEQLEIAPSLVFKELQGQMNRLPNQLSLSIKGLNAEIGDSILDFVKKNCDRTQKKLKNSR